MGNFGVLSLVIFTPLIGALLLLICPLYWSCSDPDGSRSKRLGFCIAALTLAIACVLTNEFQVGQVGYQFVEERRWFSDYGVFWRVGIDGVSLSLVLLTAALMPLVILAALPDTQGVRGYLCSVLVLETAVLGSLLALDLLLFYIFWELMLAPLFFIIGVWGGRRRIYATLKFVLYTVAGSVLMLIGILYLVWLNAQQTGELSFSLEQLLVSSRFGIVQELWLFLAFSLAFLIKIPLVPFHSWLPDAHVEAPTGGSIVLAAVLLKMGFYGMVRFAYPLFPRAAEAFAPLLVALAVVGIIYAALVAWVQTDLKKLVAYSSISHLGFCVLGLAALNVVALSGALFQMISHGIISAGLFFLVGCLYQRRHTRLIFNYGGLATSAPKLAVSWFILTLGAIGLPLTSGFVGEFMVLLGAFKSELLRTWTLVALFGIVLSAVYMLTLYQKIAFGEVRRHKGEILDSDLVRSEITFLLPLLIALIVLGSYPKPLLQLFEQPAKSMLVAQRERFLALEKFETENPSEMSEEDGDRSDPRSFQTALLSFGTGCHG